MTANHFLSFNSQPLNEAKCAGCIGPVKILLITSEGLRTHHTDLYPEETHTLTAGLDNGEENSLSCLYL